MRVVSLGPSVTRAMTALGIEEYVVGNTHYCDLSPTSKSQTIGSLLEINIEAILALEPEYIFAVGLTPQKILDKLKRFGFSVSVIDDPDSFRMLCTNMQAIAKVCGIEGTADSLIADATIRIETVQKKYHTSTPLKVGIQLVANPPYMVLDGTLGGEMIELIGGVNAFGMLKSGRVSREVVLAYDPDVLILTNMGGGAEAEIIQWQKFTNLSAVKRGALFEASSSAISSPSVPLFAAIVEELALRIYGDIHE